MSKTVEAFSSHKVYKTTDNWLGVSFISRCVCGLFSALTILANLFYFTGDNGWLLPIIFFGIASLGLAGHFVGKKMDTREQNRYIKQLGKRKVIIDAVSETSYKATVYTFSQYKIIERYGYDFMYQRPKERTVEVPNKYHWKESVSANFDSMDKAIEWTTDWISKKEQEDSAEKLEKALEADRQQALRDQRLELDF